MCSAFFVELPLLVLIQGEYSNYYGGMQPLSAMVESIKPSQISQSLNCNIRFFRLSKIFFLFLWEANFVH